MATLAARVTALAQAVGAEVKSLRSSKFDKAGGVIAGRTQFNGGIGSENRTNYNISARIEGGIVTTSGGSKALGWPSDTAFQHLINCSYADVNDYYSLQFSGPFFDNDYFFARKTTGGPTSNQPWRELAHDNNMARMPVTMPDGRTMQLGELLSLASNPLYRYGFKGDGVSRPISGQSRFNGITTAGYTLAQWQALVPQIASLTDEVDWVAMQALVNGAAGKRLFVEMPAGSTSYMNRPLDTRQVSALAIYGHGAKVILNGSAAVLFSHGSSMASPAVGAFELIGLEVENASSNAAARPFILFYAAGGIGRAKQVTMRDCGFHKFPRGGQFNNVGRGLDASNIVVFGQDFQMHTGGAFEINATADYGSGCFSYTFTNCLFANYEWGFMARFGSALEGIRMMGCSAYNGWGFCQALPLAGLAAGYKALMWHMINCDFEGLGTALDLNRCSQITVQNGFWIMSGDRGARAFPAGYVTDNSELRLVNLRECENIDLLSVNMVAGGFGDGQPNRTNFVFVNVDNLCTGVLLSDNIVTMDHAVGACCFRLSGSKARTTVERNTRIRYLWGDIPVVLYAGTGEQPYQVSHWDATRQGGTVSDEGMYEFSGTTVATTNGDGNIQIFFPGRSDVIKPETFPFFLEVPRSVSLTSEHGATYGGNYSIRGKASTNVVINVQNAGAGFTTAVNWVVRGR